MLLWVGGWIGWYRMGVGVEQILEVLVYTGNTASTGKRCFVMLFWWFDGVFVIYCHRSGGKSGGKSVEIGGCWCQWMWEWVIWRKNWLHPARRTWSLLRRRLYNAGNKLRNQVCGRTAEKPWNWFRNLRNIKFRENHLIAYDWGHGQAEIIH